MIEECAALDPQNLADSYHAQLATAVSEFCTPNSELVSVLNATFEEAYQLPLRGLVGSFLEPFQHSE